MKRSNNFGTAQKRRTAFEASEEQLLQTHELEALGQMAGGIAHDFNNLLTVIMLHGDILLAQLKEGSSEWRRMSEIKKAAERAATLTRELLALSCKQVS
jgi:two-component system, cell cycle sensor histidine kinase and response regulator CckA